MNIDHDGGAGFAQIKNRILENQFGMHLLELSLDQESFDELCLLLKQAAKYWKGQQQVDKQVVQYLIELLMIMWYKLKDHKNELLAAVDLAELDSMYDRLLGIALAKCFAG